VIKIKKIKMKKIELDKMTIDSIIKEYQDKLMPVEHMPKKYKISSRVFYRVLKENNINITIRKKKNYNRPPKHNLVGLRFNYLLVEDMKITEKSKDRSYRCICRCDCGRIADCNTNSLMKGLVKTCGNKECLYHRQDYTNNGKNNSKFTGHEEILGSKWSAYKAGAKKRNLEFNLDIKDAWELFIKQDKKCFFTGLDIFFGRTNTDFKNNTASLDRKDSSKGYTIDNVVWVHKKVNIMKMDLDIDEFLFFCNEISKNMKNQNYYEN